MADNRKRAPRGGKQAASGSRPIRRNDRAAASKGQRERSQAQAARPQRDRNRENSQVPKGEFIEGRRAAAEALRTGFPVKCALIAEGGERDAALSRLVVRRSNWINIIRQCQDRPAGTTAKQWLVENDISEKSYYYWLRKIRREVCEQEGLQEDTNPSALSFVEIPVKTALDTTPVPAVPAAMTPVAVIRSGRLTLELSNDISESLLCRLLQEVLHA